MTVLRSRTATAPGRSADSGILLNRSADSGAHPALSNELQDVAARVAQPQPARRRRDRGVEHIDHRRHHLVERHRRGQIETDALQPPQAILDANRQRCRRDLAVRREPTLASTRSTERIVPHRGAVCPHPDRHHRAAPRQLSEGCTPRTPDSSARRRRPSGRPQRCRRSQDVQLASVADVNEADLETRSSPLLRSCIGTTSRVSPSCRVVARAAIDRSQPDPSTNTATPCGRHEPPCCLIKCLVSPATALKEPGTGIEPGDLMITNQVLYQLS